MRTRNMIVFQQMLDSMVEYFSKIVPEHMANAAAGSVVGQYHHLGRIRMEFPLSPLDRMVSPYARESVDAGIEFRSLLGTGSNQRYPEGIKWVGTSWQVWSIQTTIVMDRILGSGEFVGRAGRSVVSQIEHTFKTIPLRYTGIVLLDAPKEYFKIPLNMEVTRKPRYIIPIAVNADCDLYMPGGMIKEIKANRKGLNQVDREGICVPLI